MDKIENQNYSGSGVYVAPFLDHIRMKSIGEILPTIPDLTKVNFAKIFDGGHVHIGENLYAPYYCQPSIHWPSDLEPVKGEELISNTSDNASYKYPDMPMFQTPNIEILSSGAMTPYYSILKMLVIAFSKTKRQDVYDILGDISWTTPNSIIHVEQQVTIDFEEELDIEIILKWCYAFINAYEADGVYAIQSLYQDSSSLSVHQTGIYVKKVSTGEFLKVFPFFNLLLAVNQIRYDLNANDYPTSITARLSRNVLLSSTRYDITFPDTNINLLERIRVKTFTQSVIEQGLTPNAFTTNLDSFFATMPKEQIFVAISNYLGIIYGDISL
jgi:hypothetical protein